MMGAKVKTEVSKVHPSWLAVLSDPVRLNLLRCLCEAETAMSSGELAPRAHTGERTVRRHLEALVELGLAEERRGQSDGETPGRPAAAYTLVAAARQQAQTLFDLLSRPFGPSPPPSSAPPAGR
jgi:predicted ArsR family transcriptional regulator